MAKGRTPADLPVTLRGIAILAVFVLLASAVITFAFPQAKSWGLFPSGSELANSGNHLFIEGVIYYHIFISSLRVFCGFIFAYLLGLTVVILAIESSVARATVIPINAFLRYIPPTAYTMLLVGAFGVAESYKIAVVFFGIFFFLVAMIFDVLDSIDQRYLDMARLDRAGRLTTLQKIVLPWSLPRLIDVGRINLGAAWTFLVVGEMVGANSGLGYLVIVSQRFSRVGDIYWIIMTFGIIGWILDSVLKQLSRHLAPWYSATARKS
jgi:NitT/TauT family transport system permease protein